MKKRQAPKERQANPLYSMEILRETSQYTSLISLYLRLNDSMARAKEMLDSELATAHGIKCKATRKAILKSLKNLLHMLPSHTPTQYGVATFSNGTIVVPPSPLHSSIYHCGKSFYTEPLISMREEERTISVVAITESRCVVLMAKQRGKPLIPPPSPNTAQTSGVHAEDNRRPDTRGSTTRRETGTSERSPTV